MTAQRRIRDFIAEYSRRYQSLLSCSPQHYAQPMSGIVPARHYHHHGQLLFDGAFGDTGRAFSPHKTVIVDFAERSGAFGKMDYLRQRHQTNA